MKDRFTSIKFTFEGEEYECHLTPDKNIDSFDIVRQRRGMPMTPFLAVQTYRRSRLLLRTPLASMKGYERGGPEEVEEVRIHFEDKMTHTWLVPTKALVNLKVLSATDEPAVTKQTRLQPGSAVQCDGKIKTGKRRCKNLTLNQLRRNELVVHVCWQHKDQVEDILTTPGRAV